MHQEELPSIKRRFVIADIHGNYKTFVALIRKLSLHADDQLYLLGDYINKGPSSKKALDYIIELMDTYSVTCLKGNHEYMYEESSDDPYCFKDKDGVFKPKYQRFWDALKYYVELDDFYLVHASINFKLNNPFNDRKTMLWKAHRSMYNRQLVGKTVIRGHSTKSITHIKDAFRQRAHVIPLDNGAEKNTKDFKYLIALELNDWKLVMQEWIA